MPTPKAICTFIAALTMFLAITGLEALAVWGAWALLFHAPRAWFVPTWGVVVITALVLSVRWADSKQEAPK